MTTPPTVDVLNPWDSQGNHIAKASSGIYPTVRGCGGAGYQQGYLLDDRCVYAQSETGIESDA